MHFYHYIIIIIIIIIIIVKIYSAHKDSGAFASKISG